MSQLVIAVEAGTILVFNTVRKVGDAMSRKTAWLVSVFFTSLIVSSPTAAADVHALFDLTAPTTGPFPSDWFTVPDRSQNTRRRVSLPVPDCAERASDCADLSVINTLDGFNVQPRVSIPFDGPIDVSTVTSSTVFLVRLGRDGEDCAEDRQDDGGCDERSRTIGINQIVWDVLTNVLHVESDELLRQHTRYALIVTDGVRDAGGTPVEATEAFRRFRHEPRGAYRQALLDAIHAARRVGVNERDIVTASVFTTQSVTAILEKIRDQIKAATPNPADFLLGPGKTRTVFRRDAVADITFNRQIHVDGPLDPPIPVPIPLLDIFPGVVGTIAFGKYESPDYEIHPGEYIPAVGTRSGIPTVQATSDIYFNLFLPSGPQPATGWPVTIYGHGGGGTKNIQLLNVVAVMARHGIATIGINSAGHGFGSLGTLTVIDGGGNAVTFPAGGRGRDQDGDGTIDSEEGMNAAAPVEIIGNRDFYRQTAIDLMQLVRVIEQGVDVDGDFVPDLDPSRIYYFGSSQGGDYGTILLAVEPDLKAGVLNVPGTPVIDALLAPRGRPGLGNLLQSRVPSLINAPGVTTLGGVLVTPPYFNDNLPLRDGVPVPVRLADGTTYDIQSPVTNDVAGAMEIQKLLDNSGWVFQSGSTTAYARYLRKAPLPGVPGKSVIIQYGKGDMTVPNPLETAVVRAGDLADRTTFFRNDLAFAENPQLPKNPHGFMNSIGNLAARCIAVAAQGQIATFFVSDGQEVIRPEPARFFEVPIVVPLPEALSYIP
jgi:hypothetical protein